MRALLLTLMLMPGGQPDPALTLEVDAELRGEFRRMHAPAEATLVLEDGWIGADLLALWWPEIPPAALGPGRHEQNQEACEGRAVTVVETLGQGLRARKRSRTLMDACPVDWEIESVDDDGRLQMVSLSFAGRGIAVSL